MDKQEVITKYEPVFEFIDFLYSKIIFFQGFDDDIERLKKAQNKRAALNASKSYKEKKEAEVLDTQITTLNKTVKFSIINVIIEKGISIGLMKRGVGVNIDGYRLDLEPYLYTGFRTAFGDDDVPRILEYNRKYVEFRKSLPINPYKYEDLYYFFTDFEILLSELFGFFNPETKEDFELFIPKIKTVNNIREAVIALTNGESTDVLEPKKEKQTTQPTQEKGLNWSGTDLELAELLKALTESKCFSGHTDKEVFAKMFDFLNVKHSENIKRDRVQGVKRRTKDLTPFIDKLHTHLTTWINSKDC